MPIYGETAHPTHTAAATRFAGDKLRRTEQEVA